MKSYKIDVNIFRCREDEDALAYLSLLSSNDAAFPFDITIESLTIITPKITAVIVLKC